MTRNLSLNKAYRRGYRDGNDGKAKKPTMHWSADVKAYYNDGFEVGAADLRELRAKRSGIKGPRSLDPQRA